jgi:hypothetical protein
MPDLITTYAPERAALRERHRRRVPERHPLNPWDLYLHDAERTPEAWADAFVAAHYLQLSPRFVMTPNREEAFALMGQAGFPVVPHARVGSLAFRGAAFAEVVVYTSDYGGHVGLDKQRCSRVVAQRDWTGALCSAFVGAGDGVSYRLLKVGTAALFIRMVSTSDWRSNVGAGQATWHPEPIQVDLGEQIELLLGPLWAVDFVADAAGQLWAVDFNTTPGVKSIDAGLAFQAFGSDGLYGPLRRWFALHPLPVPIPD